MNKLERFANLVYHQLFCFIVKMNNVLNRLFLDRLISFLYFSKRMVGLNYYKARSYEELKEKRRPAIEVVNRLHANVYFTGFVMILQLNVIWIILLCNYSFINIISSHKVLIGVALLVVNYLFCRRMVFSKEKDVTFKKRFRKIVRHSDNKQSLFVWLFIVVNLLLFGGLPILIIKLNH